MAGFRRDGHIYSYNLYIICMMLSRILGDTYSYMCNSLTHMDLEDFACMHGTDNSSLLANCEIAQLQQTTEIQSYITWYIWCVQYI